MKLSKKRWVILSYLMIRISHSHCINNAELVATIIAVHFLIIPFLWVVHGIIHSHQYFLSTPLWSKSVCKCVLQRHDSYWKGIILLPKNNYASARNLEHGLEFEDTCFKRTIFRKKYCADKGRTSTLKMEPSGNSCLIVNKQYWL